MKTARVLTILVLGLCLTACLTGISQAAQMGTAFTYQGHLYDNNDVANDFYDFQFKLYDANSDGNQVGEDVNKPDVDVIDGYFTVELDFGNVFDGNAVWLDIGVRPGEMNDPNVYTFLSPRQEVTPMPYALYSKSSAADSYWIVSGDNMYAGVSGKVGIGTTSPGTKFHVYEQSSSDVYLSVEASSSTAEAGVRLVNPAGGWDVFANNDDGDFGIAHAQSDRVVTIKKATGDMGIGTMAPDAKLHVDGALRLGDGSREFEILEVIPWDANGWADYIGYGGIGIGSNDGTYRQMFMFTDGVSSENIFTVATSDNSGSSWEAELVIQQNGNVGIGTTIPISKLQVEGSLRVSESGDFLGSFLRTYGNLIPNGEIYKQGTDPVYINDDLDVNGKIYQRGILIHADYVFERGYALESIDEHSEFMWSNKHLPAIPKAEVNESGQQIIEVGAHRRGIVEELEKAHIYIEQLHNQNRALEKRVEALEKMILQQQFISAKEVYDDIN